MDAISQFKENQKLAWANFAVLENMTGSVAPSLVRFAGITAGAEVLDVACGKGVAANVKLFVDGTAVGSGDLPVTIPISIGLAAGFSVGADAGSPVMEDTDYKTPFAFTGTIKKAMVDVSGEIIEDQAAKMRMYLARQ